MRSWGYRPSDAELATLHAAVATFRETWEPILPLYPSAFDGSGSVEDVHAIDYLEYESISFPKCGEDGAALICGEVLRRCAGLEWAIDYRGEWFVTTAEDAWPRVAICPLARLRELEYSSTPQFGRRFRFLACAALECLGIADASAERSLRDFITQQGEYIEQLRRSIDLVRGQSRG